MGCPSEVNIGDNLVFSVCTHDPDTGVLTDADAVPTYLVYEDETGTAILTGSMAKLDDANTTGFYTELIACTTGNGFEDGKSYTVYIEATVDSDTGGISYGFKATAGVDITQTVQQAIAAEVLKRAVSSVEGTADTTSLAALILATLESEVSGTVWTIRKTDGTTFDTKDLTLDESADPITGVT